MHDKNRGALSLVRVLSGTLKTGDKVTTSNGKTEIVQRIYEPLADEYREISEVNQGNVGICAGLKVNIAFKNRPKCVNKLFGSFLSISPNRRLQQPVTCSYRV